jgi:hypothetical protein
MPSHTYRCPFGVTLLRADNAGSLRQKIKDHNITAHGAYALVVCGARAVGADRVAVSAYRRVAPGDGHKTQSDRGI